MAKSRHTSLRSLQKYAGPASTPSPSSPPTTTPPAAAHSHPRRHAPKSAENRASPSAEHHTYGGIKSPGDP
jgi:hypothetical protein